MKTGRLSKSEWEYIDRHYKEMTIDQLAEKMDRSPDPIIAYLNKTGQGSNQKNTLIAQAENDIKTKPYWKELKQQFSEEELELFIAHWKDIIAQFRKDVLATEELQIIDVIKLEILMNRALREQKENADLISDYQDEINDLRNQPLEGETLERITELERNIAMCRAARPQLTTEYKDLQTKKSALFKDLKATREQRIAKLEDTKESFAGLIRKLNSDPDFIKEQNEYMEKMRLAVLEERKRLGDYHNYDDGMVDQPLLNSDNVLED